MPQQDDISSSPSDSNNSNNSSTGGLSFVSQSLPPTPETSFSYIEDEKVDRLDFYLVEFDRHAYRYVWINVLILIDLFLILNLIGDNLNTYIYLFYILFVAKFYILFFNQLKLNK